MATSHMWSMWNSIFNLSILITLCSHVWFMATILDTADIQREMFMSSGLKLFYLREIKRSEKKFGWHEEVRIICLLSIYLSLYLSSVCLSTYLCTYLSIHLSIWERVTTFSWGKKEEMLFSTLRWAQDYLL